MRRIGILMVTAMLTLIACGNQLVSSSAQPSSTTLTSSPVSTSQPEGTSSSPPSTSTSLADTSPEITVADMAKAYELDRPMASELPPAEWAGIRRDGDSLVVVLAGSEEPEQIVAVLPGGDATEDGLYDLGATDLSLDALTLSAALCCEPASGSIVVLNRADGSQLVGDQGVKTDQFGRALTRVDGSGFAVVWREWGPRDGLLEVAGVDDIRDIVLLSTEEQPAAALLRHASAGWLITLWEGGLVGNLALPNDGWCGMVGLAGGSLGLLVDRESTSCEAADELTVLSDDAETEPRTLVFEGAAVSANSDASGTYVIYATTEGAVRWLSVDGREGELAVPDGYEAADW